ncbi:hypothetical protein [Nocardia brevicatena]|nr:hypothetical protein [Nocardia brevicatena]
MEILDVMVAFAKTGRIGRLRTGLQGAALEEALNEVGVDFDAP